jgi:hypothetical protein
MAVRVAAIIAVMAVVVAFLEGLAIRRLRAELQTLRSARDAVKAEVAPAPARQSVDDVSQAVRWLDAFYADVEQGFARPGGLCAGGRIDDRALADALGTAFLPARAAGQSEVEAIDAMRTSLRRTETYRTLHPDLALPGDGR